VFLIGRPKAIAFVSELPINLELLLLQAQTAPIGALRRLPTLRLTQVRHYPLSQIADRVQIAYGEALCGRSRIYWFRGRQICPIVNVVLNYNGSP
jgi:hypothetical protein